MWNRPPARIELRKKSHAREKDSDAASDTPKFDGNLDRNNKMGEPEDQLPHPIDRIGPENPRPKSTMSRSW
jgi:hypothetical protein